jgi:predicted  nucleic acid-binding Zn-ribbon protein
MKSKPSKTKTKREIKKLKRQIELLNQIRNRWINRHIQYRDGTKLVLQIYSDLLSLSSKSLDREGDYGKATIDRHQSQVLREITS